MVNFTGAPSFNTACSLAALRLARFFICSGFACLVSYSFLYFRFLLVAILPSLLKVDFSC